MVLVVVVAIIGVLVIGGTLFFVLRGSGGDNAKAPTTGKVITTPTPEASATKAPTQAPAPTKATALIAVYNGTSQDGLAGTIRDQLRTDGYPDNHLGADTAPPEQQRTTSVVMYRRGAKTAAQGVAESLGINAVQQLDQATQTLIANAPKKWNVVVIVGSDKTN
jgi:hypothetical protein